MSDVIEPDQHTLTYTGFVDPDPERLLGPGLDGRMWRVVGAQFDTEANETFVTCEAVA